MKTIQQLKIAVILSVSIATVSNGQDQKKFSIYLNTEKDGKSMVVDTTFESREAMESYMKSEAFEVPEAPESIELPPIPDLPELPDMKQIIINIDDIELSSEEKSLIKQEMEEAMKEIEKAGREIEMNKKEIEKAQKEMKKMKIEIEEIPDSEHQNLIIRKISGNKDDVNTNDQNVIICVTDTSKINNSEYRIIRIESDKNTDTKKQVRVFRKAIEDDKQVAGGAKSFTTEISEPTTQPATISDRQPAAADDHLLKASDFKIYPNPTQGKINVSFKVEQNGQVQVRILDGTGRIVVDETVDVDNGIFNKEYNIEGKAKGTYLLQLKQGNQWRHEKIIMK